LGNKGVGNKGVGNKGVGSREKARGKRQEARGKRENNPMYLIVMQTTVLAISDQLLNKRALLSGGMNRSGVGILPAWK